MKRIYFLVIMVLQCGSLLAQDFDRVDAIIQLYPKQVESPEDLAKFIHRDFTSEAEKVRAIYGWLIHNVAYDPNEYKKFDYRFTNFRERNQKEERTRNKIIERTLQTGKAVCEGYAFVFEKLCELEGIENYIVRGDTKTQTKDIGREFQKNHMWNAVRVDGTWQLFDATWGAGKFRGKFIPEASYYYFKTPPEAFIKSHYPEMEEDTFLKRPVSFHEFTNRPLIIAPSLLPEALLSPQKGILYSNSSMNEIYFEIKATAPATIHYAYGTKKESVIFSNKEGILQFTVPVQMGDDSLIIYFDDTPVLGYKIE
ncbi:MAG TPA: transglutaminase domain-containing protein [Flavobacteriaceae bacterium]|nr:hypothetical protein [Flavobacteriaceae bacterium]MCB9214067.1 hypothetical protein [Alteromonas sp.]HPF11599.1 transglutaminase domain-containing protein [Flavobacteriaceae bacterium]HQU21817.1 transglutaminase domain-containing protein [Flavobacteriaceae bacterium]HQU65284.1 transglutaminase domain-containing protein [Flavobacteriaceae bacterium]